MIRIAIVEDELDMANDIINHVKEFFDNQNVSTQIVHFNNALDIIDDYKSEYDLIFMDINLPTINGMEAAKKIRSLDNSVMIVFITSLAQYAIKGYEVKAFDFILKPINTYNFTYKLKNIFNCLQQKKDDEIWISNKEGKMKLAISSIYYIEVVQHMLFYHTSKGNFKATGSLNSIYEALNKYNFALCNRCYLVNLKYVRGIKKGMVIINDEELIISRAKQSEFMKRLNDYLAEGE